MSKPSVIQFSDYTKKSGKLGSNEGGFFIHKATGKEYYIKWLPEDLLEKEKQFFKQEDLAKGKYKNRHRNRFNNEALAASIYELYGVSVPKMEFITFVDEQGVKYYGIASEKQEGITKLADIKDGKTFEGARRKAQEDFLIDVLLSNYDVVGWGMDNMYYNPKTKEVFRLDPGAALRYYAQGKAKKEEFNAEVGEFEDMESGYPVKTKFNKGPLSDAGRVFKGVHDSPTLLISLKKLLSVTDEQLRVCVEKNGFDTGVPGNKGSKKNEEIIGQLLARKQTLIVKAEEKILNRLMTGLKTTEERKEYLKEAGISEEHIAKICSAIENKSTKKEVGALIRAAINPSVTLKVTQSSPQQKKTSSTLLMTKEIGSNAQALCTQLKLDGVTIIPRVANFRTGEGNEEYNAKQPLEKIQFEFNTEEDRTNFVKYIKSIGGETAILYEGYGKSVPPHPIVQLEPQFVASYKSPVTIVESVKTEQLKIDIPFDMADEATQFNQIVRDFLHSRASEDPVSYPKQYHDNEEPNQIQRVKHGGMHASRTTLHTEKLISLLQEAGYEPVIGLTPKDRFLIKVAAMFHDTGRGIDSGNDQEKWEQDGAQKCMKWLAERGFSQQDIDKVCEAVAHKDNKEVQGKNIYALVLAGSDSLDWVRSHSSNFNAKFMPEIIKKYIPEETLNKLALVAKKIAVSQGDSPNDYMDIKGNFDIPTKKKYEHSPRGCYSATQEAYLRFASELDQVKIAKKEGAHQVKPIISDPATKQSQQEEQLKKQQQEELLKKQQEEQLKEKLAPHKVQFEVLVRKLEEKTKELKSKEKTDNGYKEIVGEMQKLYTKLNQESESFFAAPSAESFEDFQRNCKSAIKNVESTADQHRGWHKVHPIIRSILGVLAAIAIIPALVVEAKSKHGYLQTFFAKPQTDTTQKLSEFNRKFSEEIKEIEEIEEIKSGSKKW